MNYETYFQNVPGLVDCFRNGKGFSSDGVYSKFKLCLTATNLEYLVGKLFELSQVDDCYRVKYRPNEKSGMYLGRVIMITDESVGECWKKLREDKNFLCSVQDDEFCRRFRDQSRVESIRCRIKKSLG